MSKSQRKIKEEKKDAYKPLVYICAPYRGDIEANIKKAIKLGRFAYIEGNIPIIPHVLFPFMDDSNEVDRKNAMFADIILLGKCSEIWVLGDNITEGMKVEIDVAKKHHKTIKYFTEVK
jgi:hypothetical protein